MFVFPRMKVSILMHILEFFTNYRMHLTAESTHLELKKFLFLYSGRLNSGSCRDRENASELDVTGLYCTKSLKL